ncbi:MAG: hypothetical protein HZA54_16545 [Planctomycetes bacterium]|nr:hypothetical protein [Planctomycetota bacterium]
MKWLLGLLAVLLVLTPTLSFACPPPAAPDYSGPEVGDGPLPVGTAHGGVEASPGGDDGSLPPPSDISTTDFVL